MEQTGHHGPEHSFGSMGEDVVIKVHYRLKGLKIFFPPARGYEGLKLWEPTRGGGRGFDNGDEHL